MPSTTIVLSHGTRSLFGRSSDSFGADGAVGAAAQASERTDVMTIDRRSSEEIGRGTGGSGERELYPYLAQRVRPTCQVKRITLRGLPCTPR